jgi:hypothetical protein
MRIAALCGGLAITLSLVGCGQGPQGEKGDPGPTGPAGPQGARSRWTAGPTWSAGVAGPRGGFELHVRKLRRRMPGRRAPPHRLLRPHTKSGLLSGRTVRVLPRARRNEQPARRRVPGNVVAPAHCAMSASTGRPVGPEEVPDRVIWAAPEAGQLAMDGRHRQGHEPELRSIGITCAATLRSDRAAMRGAPDTSRRTCR